MIQTKNETYHLIFDFDGTLVDSLHAAIQTWGALADELNFKKIEPHEIEMLRNLTSKELVKYLQIPFYKLPKVLRYAREHMQNKMPSLPTFPGLPEVLNELQQLGVVSRNPKKKASFCVTLKVSSKNTSKL